VFWSEDWSVCALLKSLAQHVTRTIYRWLTVNRTRCFCITINQASLYRSSSLCLMNEFKDSEYVDSTSTLSLWYRQGLLCQWESGEREWGWLTIPDNLIFDSKLFIYLFRVVIFFFSLFVPTPWLHPNVNHACNLRYTQIVHPPCDYHLPCPASSVPAWGPEPCFVVQAPLQLEINNDMLVLPPIEGTQFASSTDLIVACQRFVLGLCDKQTFFGRSERILAFKVRSQL